MQNGNVKCIITVMAAAMLLAGCGSTAANSGNKEEMTAESQSEISSEENETESVTKGIETEETTESEENADDRETDIQDDGEGIEWAKSMIDTVEDPCLIVWNDITGYKNQIAYNSLTEVKEGDQFAVVAPTGDPVKEIQMKQRDETQEAGDLIDTELEVVVENQLFLVKFDYSKISSGILNYISEIKTEKYNGSDKALFWIMGQFQVSEKAI